MLGDVIFKQRNLGIKKLFTRNIIFQTRSIQPLWAETKISKISEMIIREFSTTQA